MAHDLHRLQANVPGATEDRRLALAVRLVTAEQLAYASGLIPEHSNVHILWDFTHAPDCPKRWDACTCEPGIQMSWYLTHALSQTVQ